MYIYYSLRARNMAVLAFKCQNNVESKRPCYSCPFVLQVEPQDLVGYAAPSEEAQPGAVVIPDHHSYSCIA
jgi:hypothetical protein